MRDCLPIFFSLLAGCYATSGTKLEMWLTVFFSLLDLMSSVRSDLLGILMPALIDSFFSTVCVCRPWKMLAHVFTLSFVGFTSDIQ